MKKIILIIIVLSFSTKSFAQESKLEFGLYNVALGGFVGGIGSLINKEKNEKPLKAFTNGFWKGTLGGGMIHISKMSSYEIGRKNNYSYSWLAKINNSLGTSFVENAALNRPIFSNINLNLFGFNRIEFSIENHLKVRYKLMPVSFLMSTYAFATNKFEISKTISTGELVFSSNKVISTNYKAYTIGTTIVLNSNFVDNKKTFSHELIHVYQYYDYAFVNSFLNKPITRIKSKSNFLSNYDFLYFDLQAPLLFSLYSIEKSKNKYYDNFFEKEAGFYSNTLNDL